MIALYRYSLPFQAPFETAGRTYRFREGLIVRYSDGEVDLAGESAPLPGYSKDTIRQAGDSLQTHMNETDRFLATLTRPDQLLDFTDLHDFPPSVSFAVSCLGIRLIATRNPNSLRVRGRLIDATECTLHVNAVVGVGRPEDVHPEIETLYRKGYRTIKLKCGPDPGKLPAVLHRAADVMPDVRFRIDANQSWPLEQAGTFISTFKHLPVEYIEEPSKLENVEQVSILRDRSSIPIALDESITSTDSLRKVLQLNATDVVILKPAKFGNVLKLFETIQSENTHETRIVCSTTLESGVGRWSITESAALIGSVDLAQGLGTGRLFSRDLISLNSDKAEIKAGGRGFCPDFAHCNGAMLEKIDTA